MNYNRIKEEIKRRSLNEKYFIPENSELSVQGFNKSIKNETLKVKDLITISKGLKIPVAYWFREEDMILEESQHPYGAKIEKLNRLVDDLLDDKKRLKQEIDDLRGRLGLSQTGS